MFLSIQYKNFMDRMASGIKLIEEDRKRKLMIQKAKDGQKDLEFINKIKGT